MAPERGTPRLVREVNGVRSPVESVDFGVVERTEPIEVPLWLENVGPGRLVFERAESVGGSEVLVNGVGSVSAPFSVTIPDGTLEPGASVAVSVVFRGSASARETGLVHAFFSSSTLEGPLVLSITAQPASACERGFFAGLDFDGVEVGDDVRATIELSNPTPKTLELAVTDYPTGSAFRPENDITRQSVASGGTASFAVRFNPLSEGLFLDEVTVVDACGSTRTRLLGTGMRGVLRFNPSPVDFGFVPLAAPRERVVTLSNFGASPVTVRDLVTAAPFSVVAPASTLVVPGASRDSRTFQLQPGTLDVTLRFTPTRLGTTQGTLTLATGLPRQPRLVIPLTGTGGAPAIEVASSLDLGRVAFFLGRDTSTWAPLPIKNIGSQPLEFPVMPTVVTSANRETTATDLCVGVRAASLCQSATFRTIQPGETLEVPITVTPSSLTSAPDGTKAWDIELRSNDPIQPVVTVRVVARPIALPPCQATVSGPLDFGVVSDVLPKERAFRFCNVAPPSHGGQCLISRIDVVPGARDTFSVDVPVVDRLLDGGQCLTVVVKGRQAGALPSQSTTVTGFLSVASSVDSSFTGVPLTATQAESCLVVDPTPLDFGKVTVGCQSVDRTVRVYSRCRFPVAITGLSLVDDGAPGAATPPFSTVGAPVLATLPRCTTQAVSAACLASGSAATLQVRYRPGQAGRDVGAVRVTSNQNGVPLDTVLSLRGEGVPTARVTDRLPIGAPAARDVLLMLDSTPSFDARRLEVVRDIGELTRFATNAGIDARIAVVLLGESSSTQCPACGPGRMAATDAGVRFFSVSSSDFTTEFQQVVPLRGLGDVEDFDGDVASALAAPRIFDRASNAGFLRDTASLGVLAVSDVGSLWPGGVPTLPFLASIKGADRPGQLSVSLVTVGGLAPPPDTCGQLPVPPDPLVTSTFGAQENYCTAGIGQALASVAPAVFGRQERAWLKGTPAPAGVVAVSLNGAPVPTSSWRYEALTNTIALDGAAVPATPGASLDVTYDLACLPP